MSAGGLMFRQKRLLEVVVMGRWLPPGCSPSSSPSSSSQVQPLELLRSPFPCDSLCPATA